MMGGWHRISTAQRLLLSLWVLCALPAMAVDVSLPDTSVGYGTAVVLPLRLTNVAPEGIVAVEFDIAFDPQVFILDSLSTVGTGLSSWYADSVRTGGASGDTLRWLAATDTLTISTDGVVLWLYGHVVDRRVSTTTPLALPHVVLNDGSPPTVVDEGSITLLGADAVVAATPEPVSLDGTINIQVTDTDADTSGVADAVEIRVTGNGDTETLLATESGVATGVFNAAIDVVLGVTPIVEDGQIQAFANVTINVCFTDSIDAVGATIERCAAVQVFGGDDGELTSTVVLQPGDALHVRLEDTDLVTLDTADVTIVNGRTAESEAVRLPQTDDGGGVFYAILLSSFGATTGANNDGVMSAQKGDSLFVNYSDDYTALGDTATVTTFTMAVDPLGDASGNGNVRGYDAARILDHSVGAITLVGLDSLAANLDLQAPFGPITAFDASLVLQYRVGLIAQFPVQQKEADNHPQPETGSSSKVAPRYLPVALQRMPNGWLLAITGDAEIWSGQLELDEYEGEILAGPALQGSMLTRHDNGETSRLAFASAQPVPQDEVVLQLIGDERPRLHHVVFNGGQILGVIQEEVSIAATTPVAFILHPAVPNPFNPTTHIRYDLDAVAHTQLVIVNALGQQVRRLVDAVQTAGSHSVVWDGRDEAGRLLAAGIYFHQLVSGDRSATGKMVLAK
jgi:hypothetical protein